MNLDNKKIFVTGGTGSWGQELVRQLLEKFNIDKVTVFSRNENAQVIMKRLFNDSRVRFVIGDVRDKQRLNQAMKGHNIVFHLAALKHVPVGEEMPDEFIETNVVGTKNVRDCAIDNELEKVVLISTDKACSPINLYGYTKSLAEKLVIHANTLSEKTKFVCIRGGNALGSNGSVVPFFIDQIKKQNAITITDPRMTRFFLTLKQCVSLIFSATESSVGGETFVMKMPSFKITDVADVLIEKYGNKDTKVTVIGMKPGEKIDEVLISEHEAKHSYYYKDDYIFIIPQIEINSIKSLDLSSYNKFDKEKFDSSSTKSIKELKDFLSSGGFI